MKKIIKGTVILSGFSLILYSLAFIYSFPYNLGSYLPGLAGIFLTVTAVFHKKIETLTKKGPAKTIKNIAVICIFFFIVTFLAMCALIHKNAANLPQNGKDACLVLGAGLIGDRVSLTLALRLNKAAEYLEKNPETIVIVSGGMGPGETRTEALAMKNYLIHQGIEEGRILCEDKSTSTYENFKFSKKILDTHFEEKEYSLIYVTNDFHSIRAGLYAKKCGLTGEPLSSRTPLYMIPSCYAREYLAIAWFFVSAR